MVCWQKIFPMEIESRDHIIIGIRIWQNGSRRHPTSLYYHPDAEIEAQIDEIVDDYEKMQQPDGYLNTYYTVVEPGRRWTNVHRMHELYCAGHLIEVAVAYYQATGKRKNTWL
ncbi:MAG: glycoside hydrolase family 127 protein [Lachnospiraceae bacterium]|nr:glycoside hydrolase family 127 protein [Lachnospiraceae bacterium]